MAIHHFLPLLCLTASIPTMGIAQNANLGGLENSYEITQNHDYHDVVNGLVVTNYEIEDVSITTLGRTRIMANNGVHRREVIVSRTTGEVLSDLILDLPVSRQDAARQAAMAAASEPQTNQNRLGIDISGLVTLGVNNKSGGHGSATITAGKENIGGSTVDAWVSVTNGF
ncbi:hypothetical protein [Yoonia maritima]|uniref:hypothetical protein n=1 Tax=Yoonia maritima TaxID=1435347 RepID=UPI0013A63507|nr:hypothetical protein [Yoonia maritima]